MKQVAISQVVVPEGRYRRKFDETAMAELKSSIARNGLFHPITVEAQDGKWTLRAGERRFRTLSILASEGKAIRLGDQEFPVGFIPVVDFAELTPIQRLEIEVEETVVRADFTWQERTRALARLHELRKAQNPGQTIAATASEVLGKSASGDQSMVVSNALILDKHLDDPDVAKARNERDAIKVVERKAAAVQTARLAKLVDQNKTPHVLLKGDALVLLKSLPDKRFDVICTDPIYGIAADNFGTMASTGHKYEDSYKYWKETMAVFCDESFRVTKDQAHLYAFCDPRRFEEFGTLLTLANWTVFPTPMIWDKCGTGMLPHPDFGPRRTYECILYAWKGDRQVLMKGKNDVIRISTVKKLRHGAQKPVALYAELLARSARPGDSVLDCFGGTGPVLVAANRARLVATYIEGDDDAFNVATSRVHVSDIDDGAVEFDGLQDVQL